VDGPFHKHPPDRVNERQPACHGFLTHHGYHFLDSLWPAAFIRAPSVHLRRFSAAGAGRHWLNAEFLEEF
jgi:hypothetical protein